MIDPSTLKWSVKFNFLGPCPLPLLSASYSAECWRLYGIEYKKHKLSVIDDDTPQNWLCLHRELEEAVAGAICFSDHEEK